MSRRTAKTTNYAENASSDFSGEDSELEELLDSEIGMEFDPEDGELEEQEDDEFLDEDEELLDNEDRPIKARGKYKQPGVKILKQTGRQLVVRLRFADRYSYACLFEDSPPPRPPPKIEEKVEEEEPKMPKSVLVLIDPRTKAQKLSEEELVLKKAEATRKRKHFIARKLEAEKKETLERLLLKKENKSASVGPDSENARKESKKRVLITHKALFSWSSKTENTNDGHKTNVSYYSMTI